MGNEINGFGWSNNRRSTSSIQVVGVAATRGLKGLECKPLEQSLVGVGQRRSLDWVPTEAPLIKTVSRVAVFLAAGLTYPTQSSPQSRTPLEFGAAITVVSLPIFVTDGTGHAVSGLTAADLEITDDGRPVAIVGFRELDAADPLPDEKALESPAARRQYLLLFDLSFTSASGLVRARQAARQFVETRLEPRDLAAVATLSANQGVHLLVGFTSDRNQLLRAIRTLGLIQADRRADPLGLVFDLTDVGSAYADEVTGDQGRRGEANLDDTVRQIQLRYQQAQKSDYLQRTRGFLQGMADLARAIDALQGRKQVILLSSGFDATPLIGQSTQESVQTSEAVTRGRFWEVRSDERFGDVALRSEMERALRSFSMSDSVIHTVDVSGLLARGDVRHQREPGAGSGQESLARIASLSGGQFFKSTNDVDEILSDILELSRHYYLAAFEPRAAKGAGAFHKLRVRVKGKGHRVSHRSGYFEREPYAQRTPLARQFEAAELVAKGMTGGEIGVKAMAVPYRDGAGRLTLPVVLEIDGASLLQRAAGERLGLEIYGYALDQRGVVEDFVAFASNLSLPQVGARLRERGLQFHASFALKPGRHNLRFLVRDADDGRTGTQWLEVELPSFEASGVMLFPPLFMDDPQGWVVLRPASRSTPNHASPFRVADSEFVPRARPRAANGRATSVCLLAFDGGARYDPGASFEIRPQLLDADGAAVSVGGFRLERSIAEAVGFRRFVLSFTPSDVASGDYTLRVRLRDPASGRISESFQAVRVE